MAFFNEVGKKVTKASHQTLQMGKDMADMAKLNTQISEEEKQLENLYLAIGEAYVEKYGINAEEFLKDRAVAAVNTKERLSALHKLVKGIKGMVQCPSCGADVDKNSAFCSICGKPLPKAPEEDKIPCSKCGELVPKYYKFCTKCGTPVVLVREEAADASEQVNVPSENVISSNHVVSEVEVETVEAEVQTVESEEVEAEAIEMEAVEAEGIEAVEAEELEEAETETVEVETETVEAVEAETETETVEVETEAKVEVKVEVETAPMPETSMKKCSNCGAEFDEEASFCDQCGTKL